MPRLSHSTFLLFWSIVLLAFSASSNAHQLLGNAIQISVGNQHACALLKDRSVRCWGSNYFGQLGTGNRLSSEVAAVEPQGLAHDIAQISAGSSYTCAVNLNGRVYCWGHNFSNEPGTQDNKDRSTPTPVKDLPEAARAVFAGSGSTCMISVSNNVYCWGRHEYRGMADNPYNGNFLKPVKITEIENARSLFMDFSLRCAVLYSGTVMCWGSGYPAKGNIPALVQELENATSLVVGPTHLCILLADNRIRCRGDNSVGQLGNGTRQYSQAFVEVTGGAQYTALISNLARNCAISRTKQLLCWGNNGAASLGDGTNVSRSQPTLVLGINEPVVDAAIGASFTCALTESGAVHCWGRNGGGILGVGTASERPSPATVLGLPGAAAKVAVGTEHVCATLASGAVYCWGRNRYGQLGSSIEVASTHAVAVVGIQDAKGPIAAGDDHTCAIVGNGQVACWGRNNYGQLGDGSQVDKSTPVLVKGLQGVRSLAAGNRSTCAVTGDGKAFCWGDRAEQTAGDSLGSERATPNEIRGLGQPVAEIATSGGHACVLTVTGGVKCWGSNGSGQLGDGTTQRRTMPVDVIGLQTGVIGISTYSGYSCAASSTGVVKCWGATPPSWGGGNVNPQPYSINERFGYVAAKAVTAGIRHACLLSRSDSLRCWGSNDFGQIGDGSYLEQVIPVAPTGLEKQVVAAAAGYRNTCAVLRSGAVQCWGENYSGQVGDDTAEGELIPRRVLEAEPPNPALQTGWYWNPAESGRGFFFEVQDGIAFVSGFLYRSDHEPVWFVAQGRMSGNQLVASMYTYVAGPSLSGDSPMPRPVYGLGTLKLNFTAPDQAEITWPGGTQLLTRFLVGDAGDPTSAAGETGWWWNPAEPGKGYAIEVRGQSIFMVAYHYRENGGLPSWSLAHGKVIGGRFNGQWLAYVGGQTFTGPYQAPYISYLAGDVALEFTSRTTAKLVLPNKRVIDLTRFRF